MGKTELVQEGHWKHTRDRQLRDSGLQKCPETEMMEMATVVPGAVESRLVRQVEGMLQGQMSATQGGPTQRVRNCLLSLMGFPQTAT